MNRCCPIVVLIYVSWITALSSYSPIFSGVGDSFSKQLITHMSHSLRHHRRLPMTVERRMMLQGSTISTTSTDDRLASSSLSSSSSLPSQWDFIDDVYLITTFSSNTDRLDQTRKELEKVNLW